jgi:hypothetical protein
MSRTALVGTLAFVVAGLSGCATPAKVIDQDAARVVVSIPDNTNTWPYYHRDEAQRAAGEFIHDPVLVSTARVKVGEQLTNTQDVTRRDLGKNKKFGEVMTSTNTSAVTDRYEYHLEFRSRGPVMVSTSPPGGLPAGATGNAVMPAGGGMPPTGTVGTADGWRSPSMPTHLPPMGGPTLQSPPASGGVR